MQRMRKIFVMLMPALLPVTFLSGQPGMADTVIADPGISTLLKNPVQEDVPFTVRDIHISGNRKTKEIIILRELPFQPGEQYVLPALVKKFEEARRQLMNTLLFHEVVVALKSFEGYSVDILIEVKERWYLFPIPYFKFVDRNLNQWLVEQHGRLDRVNYGVKLLYNNATGHNDKLNLWLMNGYTKQVSLSYDRPYMDKKMQWGMNMGLALGKNRELNYNTINNKQVFFKDTSHYVRSFFKAFGEITYRPAIHTRHRFGVAYTEENVTDTIVALNPAYFKNGRDEIGFPEMYYQMNFNDVDYIPYPLKGYTAEVQFVKKGLNKIIDLWQLNVKASGSWQIANNTYVGIRASGTVKLPFRQPYFNQRLLGYKDFYMQGYEYYVVDGVAGGYLKAALSKELLHLNFYIKRKKEELPYRVPFRIYAKLYANAGYMHHPQPGENSLNNRMLYSGGVGLDIITHYDFTVKLEWSFNQLGQNGLYLHRRTLY